MSNRVWSTLAITNSFALALGIGSPSPLFASTFSQVNEVSDNRLVTDIDFVGLESTKLEVVMDLLPRPLPTELTEGEIQEFKRRVKNLGLFDSVVVTREESHLRVKLSHKTTLSPNVHFSSGKTLRDSSATLGLTEYDFLGTAAALGGKLSYAERGLNFALWLDQQPYSPTKWAREYEIYRLSSGFRFTDSENTWSRNRTGGFIEWITPFHYASHLRYEFQLMAYHESFTNLSAAPSPEDGVYLGSLFEIIYDAYRWDDLTPSGYKFTLEMRPGMMTRGTFRGESRLKLITAYSFLERTALLLNASAAGVNSGDINHSILIGSQQGVRGLPDSLYRCSLVSYANLELRHSIRLFNRNFLQPTVFTDVASFLPMNSIGQTTSWTQAWSTGVGLRFIPASLTHLILRLDVSRLHLPTQTWLAQFGISQYF
jgi:hypothetical protein